MTPLFLFYPLHRLLALSKGGGGQDDEYVEDEPWVLDWWLSLCLRCVETNGAATVKLMQVRTVWPWNVPVPYPTGTVQ